MWVSSWSPDENSLALEVPIEGKRVGEKNFQQLETIDLQSLKSFAVPSSQGIHRAFWVASDTLTGATEDWKKLVALNFHIGKKTELVSGLIVAPWPSPDQKYLHWVRVGPSRKLCAFGSRTLRWPPKPPPTITTLGFRSLMLCATSAGDSTFSNPQMLHLEAQREGIALGDARRFLDNAVSKGFSDAEQPSDTSLTSLVPDWLTCENARLTVTHPMC
jgi:hypothetical protein